jgi:hypothetical protein
MVVPCAGASDGAEETTEDDEESLSDNEVSEDGIASEDTATSQDEARSETEASSERKSETEDEPESNTLRVMSWNIERLGGQTSFGVPAHRSDQVISAIAHVIQKVNPDLCAVIEVMAHQGQHELQRLCARLNEITDDPWRFVLIEGETGKAEGRANSGESYAVLYKDESGISDLGRTEYSAGTKEYPDCLICADLNADEDAYTIEIGARELSGSRARCVPGERRR